MPVEKTLFACVPRIFFGQGVIEELGPEIRRLGGKRVLVVTDPGIQSAGLDDQVTDQLKKSRLKFEVFNGVEADPPITNAEDAAAAAKEMKANLIIGLGGGSSIDTAKAAAVLMTNPGPIRDYAGMDMVPKPGAPTVFIPTTAGTGSEATCVSVLSDTENGIKIGVFSQLMYASAAFCDPTLTLTLPPRATAHTGLDALSHAVESYTGKSISLLNQPLALEAIDLIAQYLRRAYADGSDIEARTGMLKASLLAGMAFTTTQCAAAHSLSMSLGGVHHLDHGLATILFLPAVMEYNMIACPEKFAAIAELFGQPLEGMTPVEQALSGIEAVVELITDLDVELGLENHGVSRDDIDKVAQGSHNAARLWVNNPRTASLEQVKAIMEAAFLDD